MQVTLPSGNTVDFRDVMMRRDIREVQRGTKFVTGPDGSRVTDAAFLSDLAGRIVTTMIISWSFGSPTPRDCNGEDLAQRRMDEVLDGPDWISLQMAVAPWMDQALEMPTTARTVVHNGTGLRLQAVNEADAAKAIASGEFSQPGGAGPKSTLTGTTSAALPAGQG